VADGHFTLFITLTYSQKPPVAFKVSLKMSHLWDPALCLHQLGNTQIHAKQGAHYKQCALMLKRILFSHFLGSFKHHIPLYLGQSADFFLTLAFTQEFSF